MPKINRYQTSLHLYPAITATDLDQEFTIGDLHGNSLKLIHFLIRHGIMMLSQDQYLELVKLYKKMEIRFQATWNEDIWFNEFTAYKSNIEQFQEIIYEAKYNKPTKLRLLGDILSDRGCNDYLTLAILGELKKAGINFSINFSNHDLHFLIIFCNEQIGIGLPGKTLIQLLYNGTYSMQHVSLFMLSYCIQYNIVSLEEVNRLVKEAYIPHLNLIDISFDSESLNIFTHAPIDFSGIEKILRLFAIPDAASIYTNKENLFRCLSKLNHYFKLIMHDETKRNLFIHQMSVYEPLYGREQNIFHYNSTRLTPEVRALFDLIWLRVKNAYLQGYFRNPDYEVNIVHGHDGAITGERRENTEYVTYQCLEATMGMCPLGNAKDSDFELDMVSKAIMPTCPSDSSGSSSPIVPSFDLAATSSFALLSEPALVIPDVEPEDSESASKFKIYPIKPLF